MEPQIFKIPCDERIQKFIVSKCKLLLLLIMRSLITYKSFKESQIKNDRSSEKKLTY